MSNINYAAIDESFPVAGQDNDTQTFRDNFDTIKTSLRYAFEEVTDLQDNTARTDQDNDFNDKIISRAVMQYNRDAFFEAGNISGGTFTVDYENGYYHQITFNAEEIASQRQTTLSFLNFPDELLLTPGVGKVILECRSGTGLQKINFDPSGGAVYKKNNWDAGWVGNYFEVSSTQILLLEVWAYGRMNNSNTTYFIKNIGLFS